ncbi:MAG: glycosyltransferase family 39 protein [Geitlerinemataceae cyanobacterium]
MHLKAGKTGFGVLVAIVLALGIYFRFVNLDLKVYWVDETFTSLRISGYTMADFARETLNGRILTQEDLYRFQHLSPEKTVVDTVKALATEAPEHPPFYYVLVRYWVKFWGDSVAVTRSFSAVVSLLSFPAIYGLCWELFESRGDGDRSRFENPVGWMAIALIAVSPLHILYAQEAREYTLWIVMVLLSNAAFLRAIRLNTALSWILYAIALTAGFYTYPFTAFVAFGHGIYLAILERLRFNKTSISYLLASGAVILAFAPWLWVLTQNFNQASWRTESVSFLSLISGWMVNLSRVFIDISANVENPLLGLPIVALVTYSIYCLYRHTPQRVWLFILILIGVTPLALVVPDVLNGGIRSLTPRYLILSYLGIQIVVAFCFCFQCKNGLPPQRSNRIWRSIVAILIVVGILSGILSSQSKNWWNKDYYTSLYNLRAATSIEATSTPLVISDNYTIVSLNYLLPERTAFQLIPVLPSISLPTQFSDIFLYGVSPQLQSMLENDRNYRVEEIDNPLLSKIVK